MAHVALVGCQLRFRRGLEFLTLVAMGRQALGGVTREGDAAGLQVA